jgi:hypothetical protein
MFVLSEIGTMVAMGHPVDIPLIIRAFAADHYEKVLRLVYDADFLFALDAGIGEDDATAPAPTYLHSYWESIDDAREGLIFNPWTRDECLEYHREVTGRAVVLPRLPPKPTYTWGRGLRDAARGVNLSCKQCRLYRAVSIGVLDDLQDLRHQLNGLEGAVQDRGYRTHRRAAGFHQLYEAALMKETKTPATPLSKKGKNRVQTQAEKISADAAKELQRLETLPAMKWTWGPDLNEEEAVAALKFVPTKSRRCHTGYRVSLPDNSVGTASVPSSPVSEAVYSDIGSDIWEIPELDPKEVPTHFGYPPLCNYREPSAVWNGPNYSVAIPPLARHSTFVPTPENHLPITTPADAAFSSDDGPTMADAAAVYTAADAYSSDDEVPVSVAAVEYTAADAYSSDDEVPPVSDDPGMPTSPGAVSVAAGEYTAADAYSSDDEVPPVSDDISMPTSPVVSVAAVEYTAADAYSSSDVGAAAYSSDAGAEVPTMSDHAGIPTSSGAVSVAAVEYDAADAYSTASATAADVFSSSSDSDGVGPVEEINPLASVAYSDSDTSETPDSSDSVDGDHAYSTDSVDGDHAFSSESVDGDHAFSTEGDDDGDDARESRRELSVDGDHAFSTESDDDGDDAPGESRRELSVDGDHAFSTESDDNGDDAPGESRRELSVDGDHAYSSDHGGSDDSGADALGDSRRERQGTEDSECHLIALRRALLNCPPAPQDTPRRQRVRVPVSMPEPVSARLPPSVSMDD